MWLTKWIRFCFSSSVGAGVSFGAHFYLVDLWYSAGSFLEVDLSSLVASFCTAILCSLVLRLRNLLVSSAGGYPQIL